MLRVETNGRSLELLARGVYLMPGLRDGCRIMWAVDHTGTVRADRIVPSEWPTVRALGALLWWLDKHFPPPDIHLHQPVTPPRPSRPSSARDRRDTMSRVEYLLDVRRRHPPKIAPFNPDMFRRRD